MTVRLLQGDALERLAQLPEASVHCVVTSPPYFALRDYGVAGQIGLEPEADCLGWATGTPCNACFVCTMRRVFAEVWRVLRPDGTLWLNLGDSTASSGGNGAGGNAGRVGRAFQQRNVRPIKPQHLKPKNLIGIPWRVALALQADGWILRQEVIWHKKTPMPETAKDRPTRAHESLFLFAKQRYYHYDYAAIAEPCSANSHARYAQNLEAQAGSLRANGGTDPRPMKAGGRTRYPPPVGAGTTDARRDARKAYKTPSGWDTGPGSHRELAGRYPGNGVGWGYAEGADAKPRTVGRRPREKNNPNFDQAIGAGGYMPTMRNKRSVWTLGPEPFKGAHFATFPTTLVEPCILAGCPIDGTVLDPFGGSGTVGIVADRHHRHAILIELNPETVALARARITADSPLLALCE